MNAKFNQYKLSETKSIFKKKHRFLRVSIPLKKKERKNASFVCEKKT